MAAQSPFKVVKKLPGVTIQGCTTPTHLCVLLAVSEHGWLFPAASNQTRHAPAAHTDCFFRSAFASTALQCLGLPTVVPGAMGPGLFWARGERGGHPTFSCASVACAVVFARHPQAARRGRAPACSIPHNPTPLILASRSAVRAIPES